MIISFVSVMTQMSIMSFASFGNVKLYTSSALVSALSCARKKWIRKISILPTLLLTRSNLFPGLQFMASGEF